mmetsp:Transcript_25430/g.54706  ORF Transcript_25430/g.54706 Transcript_25430/m.54706 type:complete len:200 (-) Transcript_25430:293-892(-)
MPTKSRTSPVVRSHFLPRSMRSIGSLKLLGKLPAWLPPLDLEFLIVVISLLIDPPEHGLMTKRIVPSSSGIAFQALIRPFLTIMIRVFILVVILTTMVLLSFRSLSYKKNLLNQSHGSIHRNHFIKSILSPRIFLALGNLLSKYRVTNPHQHFVAGIGRISDWNFVLHEEFAEFARRPFVVGRDVVVACVVDDLTGILP